MVQKIKAAMVDADVATQAELDSEASARTTLAGRVTALEALVLTSKTAQASTSGTSIDFNDIPAGVKRITVCFDVVSTNGTDPLLIQIGDAGGIENTSYSASGGQFAGASSGAAYTTGFGLSASGGASNTISGLATLVLMDSATNTWAFSFVGGTAGTTLVFAGGSKALSATLDRVRVTTSGGTNTFDAGKINLLYE